MRPATIAAVVVAGMAIVLVLTSRNTAEHGRDATIEGVAAPIAEIRRAAWREIPDTAEATLRDRIVARLSAPDTTDGTLADAARGCFERGWPIHASHAIAAGELGDGEVFLAWFDDARFDDAPFHDDRFHDDATSAIRTLVAMDTPAGRTLLERLLQAPDARTTEVAGVLDVADAPASTRLALGRRGVPPGSIEDRTDAVRTLLATPTTDDVRVHDLAPVWALAASRSDATTTALNTRAAAGDADAARAIGLADRDRVIRAERMVLADHEFPFERRTLAAFRLLDRDAPPGDATLLNLLDDGPADRDGTVHAAALLAARGLSPTALDRLTARWLDAEHDDQRRAAVVLAATRHARGDTIGTDTISTIDRLAIDADADARVRRTAKHASRVLGRWPHEDLDATSYAARTTRLDDGRLDPDAVLLGMLANDADAARRLGESPRLDGVEDRTAAFAAAIAWRRAILSSLAPDRLAAIGEPIPGDEDDLRLWIAAIEADRLVAGPIGPPNGRPDGTRFAEPAAAGDTLRP